MLVLILEASLGSSPCTRAVHFLPDAARVVLMSCHLLGRARLRHGSAVTGVAVPCCQLHFVWVSFFRVQELLPSDGTPLKPEAFLIPH